MSLWRFWLIQRRTTGWDEAAHTRVEHGEPEIWRYLLVMGIIVLTVIVTSLTVAASPEFQEMLRSAGLQK